MGGSTNSTREYPPPSAGPAESTAGPVVRTFSLTGLDAADWSALSTVTLADDENGVEYVFTLVDAGSDKDSSNHGPTGSGVALGTDGGGAAKKEYGSDHNGVGLDIALALLFDAIAAKDQVEVVTQWADANASTTNFQELVVQIHDNESTRTSWGTAYNHGVGVRTVKRINNAGANQGAVATSPANTPPTLLGIKAYGDNFGEGSYANTGSIGDAMTFLARPEILTTETADGATDISDCHARVTAGSHGNGGWPPVLEKIQFKWWPSVVT